ncbi:asparaginase [Streptomyces sp. NTH33]|uniref:asparaginase n=1 Tax=Streptomyces sp. NTH33 TaxID=1735453 RepID=UPI000DAA454D|nr:asparaginase [Streptomyces sp. NTH33]PZH17797.1 asparaginase [Streptomyces sp. NTH33]
MPRFRLIATGGTIASRHSPLGLLAGATGAELLAQSGLGALDVEIDDFTTQGSYAFSLADLLALARRTRDALAGGADAVVITHGTDTMEESAFLLDLFHGDRRPVVLTGAQRPFDSPAPDGPANLAAAFAVAASAHARGLGSLLVFDGSAWQARGVRKVETLASGAFGSPGRGPCLRVAPDGVLPLGAQPRPPAFDLDAVDELPRVDVVAAYAGCDGALLDAAVAAGARGVVLQALGAGNACPAVVQTVKRLVARGVPVLVCSRAFSGPVTPLYTAGGGADLDRAGAVFAGDLSPWQARLLLSVALTHKPEDPGPVISQWLRRPSPDGV